MRLLVLDEADKLFELNSADRPTKGAAAGGGEGEDEGEEEDEDEDEENITATSFLSQIDELLAACDHPSVQRALFSATMGQQVTIGNRNFTQFHASNPRVRHRCLNREIII